MSTESFLVTALPYSADPGSPRHLSLFVTHRLTPDGAQGVVGDFAHVRDWTAGLAGASITVTGRVGAAPVSVPVTPLLDVLEPDLWSRVFPPDLVVLPWQTPNPTAVPWRTFPAHRMQAQSLLAHVLSLLSSPVSPPLASESVLANSLMQSLYDLPTGGGADGNNRRVSVDFVLEHIEDIDRRVSAMLDERTGVTGAGLTSTMITAPAPPPATVLLAGDAHLARRYYQRPEEQRDYQPTPNGSATPPVVQAPPDFHRRASLLGDLSPLLRRLGLIIDVRVDDVTVAGRTDRDHGHARRARVGQPGGQPASDRLCRRGNVVHGRLGHRRLHPRACSVSVTKIRSPCSTSTRTRRRSSSSSTSATCREWLRWRTTATPAARPRPRCVRPDSPLPATIGPRNCTTSSATPRAGTPR